MSTPTKPDPNNTGGVPQLGALSPLSMAKAIWNHRILCAAVWILLTAGTLYVVRRMPAVYSAETSILVESQRIPERYVSATVTPDLQDRVNALSDQILSYSRLTQLIRKFDLYREEKKKRRTIEEIVQQMRSDIKLKAENGSPGHAGSFEISYQGPDPVVVAQVVQEIGSFFVDEDIRQRSIEAEGTSTFLESQLSEARKRLEEQESMMTQYKLKFTGELPEQENALLASSGQMKTQLTGVQDELNRAEQNKSMYEAALDNAEAETATLNGIMQASAAHQVNPATAIATTDPAAQPTESERLEEKLAELKLRYGDQHPDVRRAKHQLEEARAAERKAAAAVTAKPAAVAQTTAAPPAELGRNARQGQAVAANRDRISGLKTQIASADREIANLRQERDRLTQDLNETDSHIRELPVRQQQLAAVTRDYETTQAAYKSLLDKKLAADVAAAMEKKQKAERFVLLDAARVPEKPIKPKRAALNAAGCMIALALSLMLALGLELRRGVLLGEWELPAGITILGRIPDIELAAFPGKRAA